MVEFFIAKRHIIDRKFQSIVSILGVAISLTVFVVSLSISNGLKNNMLNSILSLSPHINVSVYENYEEGYKEIVEELQKYDIKTVNPRIETQGLVNVNGLSTTSLIIGTNLELLDINMIEGVKSNSDLTGVLVGNEFLNKTGTKLGDEINIITTDTKEIRVKITGVFKTGYYTYDSELLLLPLETLQLLKEKGEIATNISINIKNPTNISNINKLVNNINNNLGDKVFAHSWNMDNQSLLSAINFEKFVLVAILSLIVLIASFAISVILNMIVREKISDIGILKAMGYSDSNVLKIFVYEGMIIGVSGMILSIILSPIVIILLKVIFKYYITTTYYLDTLPVSVSFIELSIIYLVAFILILFSTILPSMKASKMKPTDAIKYNN
ncbi:FtsX-like permease family protein [Pseudostreptobacillus hongkongensis]|uniref:ABC transporter permease n=1 Tax=Pseudostreptobacillus hongkongensis TaxID=1162717 RepID=UPI0028D75856|nr:FtsX-like permease family protein [Pseudostreptobacillus hongkongensis]